MNNPAAEQVLLVEGNDDLHVITKLLERHGIQVSFQIVPKGGFEELNRSIYNEINAPSRRALGIIADANDHPERRWQSISDRLKEANCKVPTRPVGMGSVFAGPRDIRVGVWLMPDNTRPGELEDFVADMIPGDDPVWPRAQRFIDDIPEDNRAFNAGKVVRAYVHAWLATRERPRPMGSAIAAKDLRHDEAAGSALVAWIRLLFTL